MAPFNGLGMSMGNLARLSAAESRSISPENPTGEKGRGAMAAPDPEKSPARKLGVGWKVRPYIIIAPGEVATLADIAGAGAIQQIRRISVSRRVETKEVQAKSIVPHP